jgi:hypothetical protein
MKNLKRFNEEVSLNIPTIDFLDESDFYGQLENWDSYGAIAYDSYPFETTHNTFKMLTMIKEDEKTLNKKYPEVDYEINLGSRHGELPFIQIKL